MNWTMIGLCMNYSELDWSGIYFGVNWIIFNFTKVKILNPNVWSALKMTLLWIGAI